MSVLNGGRYFGRRWVLITNNMAILAADDSGWVISHENFIKKTYEKTNHLNDVRSYCLNPVLFDIKTPFLKRKYNAGKDKNEDEEVVACKKAHQSLLSTFGGMSTPPTDSDPGNNAPAKSLADEFYRQLTRHPDCKFKGGNVSQRPLVSQIGEELYIIPERSLFYCYDIRQISEHLEGKEFDLILMDPPWWNKYIRRTRKKNNKLGYDMVYDKDLLNIPVDSMLSEEGILAIWCTSAPSHINSVLKDLFPAWDMQYVAQWFWLKVTKLGKPVCDFSKKLGKQPYERIIFGVRKNSVRSLPNPETDKVLMGVPSSIHSHKPPLCEILKRYLPEEPRCLELFARYLLPNWTSYGNEVLKLQHMSLYTEQVLEDPS